MVRCEDAGDRTFAEWREDHGGDAACRLPARHEWPCCAGASALSADPYCGDVFVFRAKRAIACAAILWDGSGMILATKWLEAGKVRWPPILDGAMQMSSQEFSLCWPLSTDSVKRNVVKAADESGLILLDLLEDSGSWLGSAMPLRPDPLPQDAAQLSRIILSLDAENADLKARVAFLEGQLFGRNRRR